MLKVVLVAVIGIVVFLYFVPTADLVKYKDRVTTGIHNVVNNFNK